MIERTPINTLNEKVGKEVVVAGSVNVRRDHGKLIFIDLRDTTGTIQMVVLPQHKQAQEIGAIIRPEWIIEVKGNVNARPEKMHKKEEENGTVELEATEITILGKAKELPFELGADLNIDTHLNHLPLTLREPRWRAVFKVQSEIIRAYREFFTQQGFIEIQAPKLIGDDAEGGANSFDVPYFGHIAHLAQSPQFYKQIMVGIFERVFTTGNVYRAEKHATSRHLNEYTSLDIEMGYITDHRDIMQIETHALRHITQTLKETCIKEFTLLNASIPEVPETIPAFKLRDAQQIIQKEFGEDCSKEPDLEPQHERWLHEYAKKAFNSDFVFVTHFPMTKRPMYTFEDPNDPGYANGFDLLFRGIEITTGGQRVHDYDTLVDQMKKKGLNPEQFNYYLQAFKYGMPPHGGFGMGLERLTAKFLNLDNVKEATLFPRDINRIDNLLTKVKE